MAISKFPLNKLSLCSSLAMLMMQLTLTLANPAVRMARSVTKQDRTPCAAIERRITLFRHNRIWSREKIPGVEEVKVDVTTRWCDETESVEQLPIRGIPMGAKLVCHQDYAYLGESALPVKVGCSLRIQQAIQIAIEPIRIPEKQIEEICRNTQEKSALFHHNKSWSTKAWTKKTRNFEVYLCERTGFDRELNKTDAKIICRQDFAPNGATSMPLVEPCSL